MGDSQGPTASVVSIIFGVLTFFVISLRMFARIYVVQKVGLDDVLMVIASIASWAFIACIVISVKYGLGDHFDAVMARGMPNLIAYAQTVWFSSIFYNLSLGFIKTSVLALYMRLGDRILTRMAVVMCVIVACQAIANVCVCIFQCDPIPSAWDVTITEKKCVDINAFYLANAALNIVTDLLTYTLPVGLVMKLQLPQKQRIILGFMLCLGLFACISSIIRITFIPRMLKSTDPTWTIAGAMYWSAIETNIGILAASIPSFKAVAQRYLPRIIGEYSSRNRTKEYEMQRSKEGQSQHNAGTNGYASRMSKSLGVDISSKGGSSNTSHSSRSADEKAGGTHPSYPQPQHARRRSDESDDSSTADSGSSRVSRSAMTTIVGRENTSEERLHVPANRIMTTTQITTTSIAQQPSLMPMAGEPLSFYTHSDDGYHQHHHPRGGVPRAGL